MKTIKKMLAEYIDSMGSDLTVVNAARVSFDKESKWTKHPDIIIENQKFIGKPCLEDKDGKLIAFLARNGHWTPFGHPQVTLRETVPIFVARQRFKHTVGFVYNEVSRRYVDDDPEFYTPTEWRGRPQGNKKQGSSEEIITHFGKAYIWDYQQDFLPDDPVTKAYTYFLNHAEFLYSSMIEAGIAPEQARMVLPQSMYTSYYVTGSLAAWARAYNLRSDAHAQKEIQDLASQWNTIIQPLFPVSWEALTLKE